MTNLLHIPYSLIRPIYRRTRFHKAVISELDSETLRGAYSQCRAITRQHAKTFYMATRFLPYSKQRGIFAIYALCRYIDDLVDEAEDLVIKQKMEPSGIFLRLAEFQQKLENTYRGVEHNDPILIAFADALKQYDISIHLPFELIEGVKMDLTKKRYQTFDELYNYSYKVASVVGLMTSEVFGYSDPKALRYAVDLGIAMQLTNILRDIGEDLDKDRIYLPQNELSDFGISEKNLFDHQNSEAFQKLMMFQIERARDFYERADVGISMLSADSRLPVALARENYSRILDKIEANNYNVFDRRAYLTSAEKLSIMPRVLMKIRSS
jgi:15-cis-phytoene synthase